MFKEKLKRLKETLKVWNKEIFGHIDQNINTLRDELHALDHQDDNGDLAAEEAFKTSEMSARLMQQLNNRRSLLSQKAGLRWIKEGDINSKLFHKAIN